ncbi:MAG: hypothetical protein ACKO2L_22370 [Planctomycetaceae bacterium]
MNGLSLHPKRLCSTVLLLVTTFLCGCGEARPPLASAAGRVVCSGVALTAGSITFVPIPENNNKTPGKAAKGEITADGSFRLTTWDAFDGAIVGRHRVEFEMAEGDDEEIEDSAAEDSEMEAAPSKKKPAPVQYFHLPGELIVEVKAGEQNQFTIELSAGKGAASEDE